jgi:hypothetical protein
MKGGSFRFFRRVDERHLLAGIAVVAALIFLSPPNPARDLATAALVAAIPGLALVPWLGIRDAGVRATLVLLISLSFTVVVAQGVMYAVSLRWTVCAAILLGAATVSAVARLVVRAKPVELR